MQVTAQIGSRTRRYDPSNGRDELNLAEFPLCFLGLRVPDHQKTVEFEDRVWDEGLQQSVHRRRTVIGSDKYGLPTMFDQSVFLGLLTIAKQTNDFAEPKVHFSRYQLAELLHLPHDGRTYQRLKTSLHRLKGTMLECERAWWDKKRQKWMSHSTGLLDEVKVYSERPQGQQDGLPLSHVIFSAVLFESCQAGFIRKFDLNFYLKLQLPAAKQAYRFLDKRFHRGEELEFELRQFACEHVGLSRNYKPSDLKRKLHPAVEELEQTGFIRTLPLEQRYTKIGHGKYKVRFEQGHKEGRAEEAKEGTLIAALTERGLKAGVARKLIEEYSEGRIREKVELLAWQLARDANAIPNPAGWLCAAIKEDYAPPKDFESSADRANKEVAAAQRKRYLESERRRLEQWSPAEHARRQARVAPYLQELDDRERRQLEQQARINASPIAYEKWRQAYGEQKEQMHELMIQDYVLSRLAETN